MDTHLQAWTIKTRSDILFNVRPEKKSQLGVLKA